MPQFQYVYTVLQLMQRGDSRGAEAFRRIRRLTTFQNLFLRKAGQEFRQHRRCALDIRRCRQRAQFLRCNRRKLLRNKQASVF